MLFDCPEMIQFRNSCGIGTFATANRFLQTLISSVKLYSLYLNDSNPDVLLKRSNTLYHMYLGWHNLMNIPL